MILLTIIIIIIISIIIIIIIILVSAGPRGRSPQARILGREIRGPPFVGGISPLKNEESARVEPPNFQIPAARIWCRIYGQLSHVQSSMFRVRVSNFRIAACLDLKISFKHSKPESLAPFFHIIISGTRCTCGAGRPGGCAQTDERPKACSARSYHIILDICVYVYIYIYIYIYVFMYLFMYLYSYVCII